jgi:hypothetical protein
MGKALIHEKYSRETYPKGVYNLYNLKKFTRSQIFGAEKHKLQPNPRAKTLYTFP